jgi:hypothetical protein
MGDILGGFSSFLTGGEQEPLFKRLGYNTQDELDAFKLADPVKYNEQLKALDLEGKLSNAQGPTGLETLGTGLSAFSTAYGLYDNMFGTANKYAKEQLGGLRDQRSAFDEARQQRRDFRNTTTQSLNSPTL